MSSSLSVPGWREVELRMEQVMTPKPVAVSKDTLAVNVLKVIEERKVDDLVVTDGSGIVQGFIDVQDLPGLKIM